jgi:hypothetical protein
VAAGGELEPAASKNGDGIFTVLPAVRLLAPRTCRKSEQNEDDCTRWGHHPTRRRTPQEEQSGCRSSKAACTPGHARARGERCVQPQDTWYY